MCIISLNSPFFINIHIYGKNIVYLYCGLFNLKLKFIKTQFDLLKYINKGCLKELKKFKNCFKKNFRFFLLFEI